MAALVQRIRARAASLPTFDIPFLLILLLLLSYGLIMLFSAGYAVALYRRGDAYTYIRPQLLFAALGAAAKNAAKQGKKFLTDLKDDSEESGAEGVPAAPAPAVETPEGEDGEKNDTPEARMTNARSMVADLLGKKKEG